MTTFKYFPHTQEDITDMLQTIRAKDIGSLYDGIPESVRLKGEYDIPSAMSEMEIRRFFERLAKKNVPLTCFAGGGTYDHYSPSVIQNIVSRSEFLTSYTPYQAEVSQGTLHYIFEYQSMMAELTGMDVSNASMYDGATATAEAAIMCVSCSKKARRILVAANINPQTLEVLKTYSHFHGIEIEEIKPENGVITLGQLEAQMDEGNPVAGVIFQQPNYLGIIEDFTGFAEAIHSRKALMVINGIPADYALLKTPGEWGADIAVGDGQSLGIPMMFGGPSLGYMCCTEKLIRKMPGRIVGATKDDKGQRAFVLTLQAREQHIRRQKATSNICSNESLMALYVTIYMALMGTEGLKEAARLSYSGAHYLCENLERTGRFSLVNRANFFNEFCVNYEGNSEELLRKWMANGILGGILLDDNSLLIAVTEKRTKEEMDRLVELSK